MRRPSASRRAFATLLVLGVIIVAAIVIGMLQASAFAQASAGRESLARVRAYWAARGGVEATLAKLEWDTENPDTGDAFAVMDAMVDVGEGQFTGASYRIATTEGKNEGVAPGNAHANLNINRLTRDQLLNLDPIMTEDVADSILDWIDADDDTRPLGAEIGYYQSLPHPHRARNGPLRSIAEMELIAGVDPRDVRGEDWNLNGLLDPNENDGDASWPPDNADGVLDRGWSGILTTASVEGTLGPSGQKVLDLRSVSDGDLATRLKITRDQAATIVDYVGQSSNARMTDFITRTLPQLARQMRQQGGQTRRVENLTSEQLGALLEETTIGEPESGANIPGKLNVNTCDAEVLQFLPEISPEIADSIISERSSRPQGFTTIGQLMDVPGMGRRQFAAIYQLLTTRSNVYVVTCRGRDERTGLEVEMEAVLDRSSLPVV